MAISRCVIPAMLYDVQKRRESVFHGFDFLLIFRNGLHLSFDNLQRLGLVGAD
jgi:hypothetical protein